MSAYTCISCHVAFSDPDQQRGHYKTDWHRYNLKRKVVGMPPVSASTFQEKVRERQVVTADKDTEGISGFWCKLCQKRFNSHNSFENHKQSKKHREYENAHLQQVKQNLSKEDLKNEKDESGLNESQSMKKAVADAKADLDKPKILRADEKVKTTKEFKSGDNPRMRWFKKQAKALKEAEHEDEWEDVDSDEEMNDEEADEEEIIMKDEDADIESLSSDILTGLKQRQISSQECLFCLKSSKDIECNVLHMSKQHGFFIPDITFLTDLEGLLNYLGEKVGMGNICLWCNEKGKAFYSISSVLKHMKDKGHCNMLVTGDAALEYADFYEFGDDEEENDVEMDSEGEEDDDNVSADIDIQDLELVLPSGSSIGHRSLMRYYKQNFPPVERHTSKKQKRLARLIAQYKAIGWHSSSASDISRAQKDMAYLRTMKSKFRLKLSMKNNKTQMKHFRIQL
ncbi:cytoplasmic 60S subunit biogenesis factor ZNF622-like [Styela clava]